MDGDLAYTKVVSIDHLLQWLLFIEVLGTMYIWMSRFFFHMLESAKLVTTNFIIEPNI